MKKILGLEKKYKHAGMLLFQSESNIQSEYLVAVCLRNELYMSRREDAATIEEYAFNQ